MLLIKVAVQHITTNNYIVKIHQILQKDARLTVRHQLG